MDYQTRCLLASFVISNIVTLSFLKVGFSLAAPKLRSLPLETQIIERYRHRPAARRKGVVQPFFATALAIAWKPAFIMRWSRMTKAV